MKNDGIFIAFHSYYYKSTAICVLHHVHKRKECFEMNKLYLSFFFCSFQPTLFLQCQGRRFDGAAFKLMQIGVPFLPCFRYALLKEEEVVSAIRHSKSFFYEVQFIKRACWVKIDSSGGRRNSYLKDTQIFFLYIFLSALKVLPTFVLIKRHSLHTFLE